MFIELSLQLLAQVKRDRDKDRDSSKKSVRSCSVKQLAGPLMSHWRQLKMRKSKHSRDLGKQHRDQPRRLFLRSCLLTLRSSRLC